MAHLYTRDELRKYLDEDFFNDPNCFWAGRRNNCAVDFCIMSWCLGLNPVDEFNKLVEEHPWDDKKVAACREHIDRVVPYLKKWGTKGTMEAMAFAINY